MVELVAEAEECNWYRTFVAAPSIHEYCAKSSRGISKIYGTAYVGLGNKIKPTHSKARIDLGSGTPSVMEGELGTDLSEIGSTEEFEIQLR